MKLMLQMSNKIQMMMMMMMMIKTKNLRFKQPLILTELIRYKTATNMSKY